MDGVPPRTDSQVPSIILRWILVAFGICVASFTIVTQPILSDEPLSHEFYISSLLWLLTAGALWIGVMWAAAAGLLAAAGFRFFLGYVSLEQELFVLIMVGVLATYGRPAVRRVYALVALAWLVSQFAGLENVQVQVLGAVVVTVLTVLAYAIGRLVRSLSRDRDRSRSKLTQVESSLAEQRSSLARELHDNAVSDLTVIVMKAQRLQLDQRDPQVVTELDSVLDRATLTIDRIGRMVTLLRDNRPVPETDDLVLPSIPESLQHFEDELSNSGIPTTVESTTGATTLGPSAQVALYHILKEAVTNVIKYGARSADGQPACHIRFAVEGDRAELCVLNQINQERQRNSPALGIGLEVLRERAEAYGAEVSVGPGGPDHWRLHVTNMRTT